MFEFFEHVSDKIFSEAGVLCGVLFIYAVYITLDNRSWRRENKKLNEDLNELGKQQITASINTHNVLDKISDALKAISDRLLERK